MTWPRIALSSLWGMKPRVSSNSLAPRAAWSAAGLGEGALAAGASEPPEKCSALAPGHAAHQVDQHERALPLEQIAERLLAVQVFLADQVQDVVLDLEGDAA